jgi:uncharacterized membrane protein YfcA
VTRGLGVTSFGEGLLGYVYMPGLVAIVCTTIVCAPIGVRLAHGLQPLPLRRAFGALLIVVSIRMLWSGLFP